MASGIRRGTLVFLVALLLTAALGGCSLERSGYQFVRNQPTGTYLKVPSEWTVFDDRFIMNRLEEQGTANEAKWVRTTFVTTFAAGQPKQVFPDGRGEEPAGLLRVRNLSPLERDRTSLATSRGEFVGQFDLGVQNGQIQVLTGYDIVRPDGVRGERLVYNFHEGEGVTYTIDQTVLLDAATSRQYFLFVGCTSSCFERNRSEIEDVVTSLTVKEK